MSECVSDARHQRGKSRSYCKDYFSNTHLFISMSRWSPLAMAIPLWMCFGRAAAGLHEPQICYILDGILFLYGLVLTTLYCRLKIINCKKAEKQKEGTEEGIYTGLTQPADTYETIGMKT